MAYIQDKDTVRANFKGARILVVEDNDDYWLLIRQAIAQVLPEVTPIRATSYEETHNLLVEWARDEWEMPKLVLLDLYLPERSQGWKVLAHIREMDPPFNQLPVVLLSSSSENADITEAYNRGGSAYLVKPTVFPDWIEYFKQLRSYWWETVTLPTIRPSF